LIYSKNNKTIAFFHVFTILTNNYFFVPKLQLGECIPKVHIYSDATNVGMLLHTPNEDVGSEKIDILKILIDLFKKQQNYCILSYFYHFN